MNEEEKIVQIKALVEEIDKKLGKIKNLLGSEKDQEWQQQYERRMNILTEIYRRNGIVTDEELREIANRHGMDMRGVGGFFVGEGSLVKISGDRTALTERGRKAVEEWLEERGEE